MLAVLIRFKYKLNIGACDGVSTVIQYLNFLLGLVCVISRQGAIQFYLYETRIYKDIVRVKGTIRVIFVFALTIALPLCMPAFFADGSPVLL